MAPPPVVPSDSTDEVRSGGGLRAATVAQTMATGRGESRVRSATGIAIATAVVVPTLSLGGYTTSSRLLFTGLAGAALLCALLFDEDRVRAIARTTPVVVLAALSALALISTAWSIDATASVRWALVIAGYACIATCAAAFAADRRGVELLAALIAVTATMSALLGMVGFALHEGPFAEKIYGRWRPGGPFEYPPTLALVQVSALSALLYAMTRARRSIATAAAAAGTLAAGTIALSGSRWQIALGVAVLVGAPFLLAAARAVDRPAALVAMAAVAAGGASLYAAGRLPSGGTARLLSLVAVCAASGIVWRLAFGHLTRIGRGLRVVALAAAVLVIVLAGVAIVDLSTRLGGSGGLTHTRVDQWHDALATAERRPVLGHGADTYLAASRPERRGPRARYAHNLPLESAAELGIVGLAIVVALYVAVLLAGWLARRALAGALFAPAAVAFLATNLVDWPWHQAGAEALWAVAVGGVIAARHDYPLLQTGGLRWWRVRS